MTKRILLASMAAAGFAALVWIMIGSMKTNMFPSAHADFTHGASWYDRNETVGDHTAGPYAHAEARARSFWSVFRHTPEVWVTPGYGNLENADVPFGADRAWVGTVDLTTITIKDGEPPKREHRENEPIQIVVEGVSVQVGGPGKEFTILFGLVEGIDGLEEGGLEGGLEGGMEGVKTGRALDLLFAKPIKHVVQGEIVEEKTMAPHLKGAPIWFHFGEGDSVGATGDGDFIGISFYVWDADHGHDDSSSDDDFGSRD